MVPIKWDRDTCVRCNMVISDPRFAADLSFLGNRLGLTFEAYEFDREDAVTFLQGQLTNDVASATADRAILGGGANSVKGLDEAIDLYRQALVAGVDDELGQPRARAQHRGERPEREPAQQDDRNNGKISLPPCDRKNSQNAYC